MNAEHLQPADDWTMVTTDERNPSFTIDETSDGMIVEMNPPQISIQASQDWDDEDAQSVDSNGPVVPSTLSDARQGGEKRLEDEYNDTLSFMTRVLVGGVQEQDTKAQLNQIARFLRRYWSELEPMKTAMPFLAKLMRNEAVGRFVSTHSNLTYVKWVLEQHDSLTPIAAFVCLEMIEFLLWPSKSSVR